MPLAFIISNWRTAVPLIAIGVLLLALGFQTFRVETQKLIVSDIRRMQAEAEAKAIAQGAADQKKADGVSLTFAGKEAADQSNETTKTITITKWAIRHVKDTANCPGPALVRVWDSAATGADPESLVYGAASSDGPGQVLKNPGTP